MIKQSYSGDVRVLLFAKAPVAGRVKTRFIPELGVDGALALHKSLIELTWQRITEDAQWVVELWMSESGKEQWFCRLCAADQLYVQQGEDLGARMHNALSHALQRAPYVLIVGADCVSLDSAYLREAIGCLRAGADIVLGPAEDGGYVLLGVRHHVPLSIFVGIDWGSERVLEQTCERLNALSLDWQALTPRWDVDVPADLPKLARLIEAMHSKDSVSGDAFTL